MPEEVRLWPSLSGRQHARRRHASERRDGIRLLAEQQAGAEAVPNGSGGVGVVTPSGNSFISAEMVGTASSQNIPHGLGGTPSKVNVTPVGLKSGETGRFTYTEGAHDTTNVVLTVPAGRRYKVVAS